MEDEVKKVENPAEGTPDTGGESPKPKKKSKARMIILVVVIAVVLLFGGGGVVYATQHSNPQFCNLICHTPMDPYVTSYMDGVSVNPLQADSGAPLDVVAHRDSTQGVVCVDCHTDGIDTQMAEGLAWVSGNYTQPLTPLTMVGKVPTDENPDVVTERHQRGGIETCLNAGCHVDLDISEDSTPAERMQALKDSTSHLKRNVHDSHLGVQDCTKCHQQHEQSVVICTQCHVDAEVPDGWLTFSEYQKQHPEE